MSSIWKLKVAFFRTDLGNEPVRQWLRGLPRREKKLIGEDLKTVQLGWPVGMPLVRKLGADLWEVRSKLDNRIARVLFTVRDGSMVLLHGFIKKSEKTPLNDLRLAKVRLAIVRSSL